MNTSTGTDYRTSPDYAAIKKVLRNRKEYAEAVNGQDSPEWNQIVGTGFDLANELFGTGSAGHEDRKAFVRWLFTD